MGKHNLLSLLLFRKHRQQENALRMRLDAVGNVRDQGFIEIGGTRQWVTIRGENRLNPVLLFVHGGPGSTYSIFSPCLRDWEKYFTVVQWDQRGAGKTLRYTRQNPQSLRLSRLAEDGIEVVEYLCRTYNQKKIILIGSSVGSLTGLIMAKRRPDLFYAYVGTDQNSPDPDHTGAKLARKAFQKTGNKRGLKVLEKLAANPNNLDRRNFKLLNQALIKASPEVPDMIQDLILPAILTSPDHTFKDIIDIFRGMNLSLKSLFSDLVSFDFDKLGRNFELPFFVFQGVGDIITPIQTARVYFEEIEAPHKEFFEVELAGHLACFARPAVFLDLLLKHVRPLAAPDLYPVQKQAS